MVEEDEKKLDVEKWIETVMKDEERLEIDAVAW